MGNLDDLYGLTPRELHWLVPILDPSTIRTVFGTNMDPDHDMLLRCRLWDAGYRGPLVMNPPKKDVQKSASKKRR